MKAWERRTWLCTCAEITCLRTLTGSCIARAQRTWKIDCKANFYSPPCLNITWKKNNHKQSPSYSAASTAGTLYLKERRARMLVVCWGSGTWSSPGRCSTPCTLCSVPHPVTASHTPSTPHLTATPTTSVTSSLWVAWWPRRFTTTGYWNATSRAASTNTSWAKVSGIQVSLSNS